MRKRDLLHQEFGRLRVVADAPRNRHGKRCCRCICECGNESIVVATSLTRPHGTKSCGCLVGDKVRQRSTTHGMRHSKAYEVWESMMKRCFNRRCRAFPRYGGRGISVCESWYDFAAFFADMGEPPSGHTLERKDNDKGYAPDNCRWATKLEQANNKSSNKFIEHDGRRQTIAQWARELGIKYATLQQRFCLYKMTPERALRKVVV